MRGSPAGLGFTGSGRRSNRLADSIHQCVGTAVGVLAGVAPVPARPPTTAVLSGVNRTS
jgi:hypothetical protein